MSIHQNSTALWQARICVLIVVLYSVFPLAIMLMMSFSSSSFVRFPPPSYSLRWYELYFSSTDWVEATLRSLWIGLTVSGISVLLGVPASLAIHKFGRHAANVTLAFFSMPILLPPVVIAIAMYMSFSSVGLVGTRTGIVFGHLVVAIPFVVFTTLAALRKLDPELSRAAASLGASKTRTVFTVTLPIIRPGILSGALFAFLISFDDLLVSLFIGSSEIRTLPRRMWEGIRSEFDPTIAAASTIVVLATCLVVAIAWAVPRIVRPHIVQSRE